MGGKDIKARSDIAILNSQEFIEKQIASYV